MDPTLFSETHTTEIKHCHTEFMSYKKYKIW